MLLLLWVGAAAEDGKFAFEIGYPRLERSRLFVLQACDASFELQSATACEVVSGGSEVREEAERTHFSMLASSFPFPSAVCSKMHSTLALRHLEKARGQLEALLLA